MTWVVSAMFLVMLFCVVLWPTVMLLCDIIHNLKEKGKR